ncbi:cytochrome c oxidase assembly protein [Actinomycetota bacterium]
MSSPTTARQSASWWLPMLLTLGAGALATVISAVALGTATPLEIGDPGPVARWGGLLARIVHDVAAATTVGLLGFAAFLTPETNRTDRRITATRYAALAALLWVVAGVLSLLFTFANLAGLAIGAPGFGQQFTRFAWALEPTRVAVISLLGAVVVGTIAAVARTRTAMAWASVLSVLSVLPLALAGHAAGAVGHDTAVNSMAFHLMCATIWLGGLIALIGFRTELGRDLPVTVRRFATLAAWCFVVVLVSGLLAGSVRFNALGDVFSSSYGRLLLVKVVALAALAAAGWLQRSRMLDRLDANHDDVAAFARLAIGEVMLMGVAIGAAVTLARSAPPVSDEAPPNPDPTLALTGYPSPPPLSMDTYFTMWRWDWLWLLVGLACIGLYWYGYRRLRRRGDSWPLRRPIMWTLGWAVIIYSMCGAPGIYARVLFSQHMLMHMFIAMLAPILLVPAAPITLALRTIPARRDKTWGVREMILKIVHSHYLRFFANPVMAAGFFFVSMAVFYYSPLFELALRTHTGHILMMVHFLMAGYIFVWVLIGIDPGPPKWSPLMRLVILFATISFHAFFGVAMTGGDTVLAKGFFEAIHQPWMEPMLDDQHKAGAIAWGISEAPTLLLAMLVGLAWMREDRQETTRKDRQADRDGDAELAAYNAHLAALKERDDQQGRQP